MRKFNLQEFLKNPALKVVTYQGKEVRIICTDGNDGEYPVVGFIGVSKYISMWSKTGKYKDSMFAFHEKNIFFEDDEMSVFEKELEMMMVSFSNSNIGSDVRKDMPKDKLHGFANRLLELARKVFEPEFEKELECAYKNADKVQFERGKQSVLNTLPKWRKHAVGVIESGYSDRPYALSGISNFALAYKGYCIDIDELFEKLQKEEDVV